LTTSAHKTEVVNRTKTVRFYPLVSTGNAPRKEMRGMPAEFVSATPLNETNIMNIPGLLETRAPGTGIWHVGERPQWK